MRRGGQRNREERQKEVEGEREERETIEGEKGIFSG